VQCFIAMTIGRVLLAHRDSAVQDLATRTLGRIGVTVDVAEGLGDGGYSVIVTERNDALLSAIAVLNPRPVVIVTAPPADQLLLDPQVVSLFVPEPYDAQMLVGVILSCVTPDMGPPLDGGPEVHTLT